MYKKNLLFSFGGGQNQEKLINIALKKKIDLLLIENKKINFDKSQTKQIKLSCYNLKQVKKKKKLFINFSKNKYTDIIYRSSGPSVLSFWYISKILNLQRVSKELAYSVYSKSYFCSILKKNKLPYIDYKILHKNKKINKFRNFVLKPDAPIVGKENVYLSQNQNIFNFNKVQNSSHNDKVICSSYIEGKDFGIFVFINKKNKKKIFLNPFVEKNKFINGKIKHIGIFKSKESSLNKKIIYLTKNILKIFPNYYGFISISYRVTKNTKIYPYEINLGLSGDMIVDKLFKKNTFKKSLYEVEIENLC